MPTPTSQATQGRHRPRPDGVTVDTLVARLQAGAQPVRTTR